jgi:FlaA1/EpsC-like NDP-sugar epimerase
MSNAIALIDKLLDRDYARKAAIIFIQVSVFALSFTLAFLVRFDGQIPPDYRLTLLAAIVPLVLIRLLVFWHLGLLSGWWSYVSLHDLGKIARAVFFGSMAFALYLLLVPPVGFLPRSVLILDGVLCFMIVTGVRVISRRLREVHAEQRKGNGPGLSHTLVIGAGAFGQMIAREIRGNPTLRTKVVGYLDDDPQRLKGNFQGLPVLGTTKELKKIARSHGVKQVIISQRAVSPQKLREIVEICQKEALESKILPAMGDIITGKVSIQHVRDVQVEDLLGRKPVQLEIGEIAQYLTGKRILVTGAGGSIGSEICRQVAAFGPARIALIENAETPLFQIEKELAGRFPNLELQPVLCDVRERSRVEAAFTVFRPEVVFHAAAYKHVPLSEANPEEVVRNNVMGSKNIADAAHAFGAAHFVMISTDKAVNPTNIMGATKRAAEVYVQDLALRSKTKFVTVRFGNVLGSNGSVVPTFREQILKGGPITVTHPDVTRFFMTIPEAVQLVLQAGSMGKGGEIFLLDMGEPVPIVHLAEEMIRLSGLRPHEDIEVVFTGLRPGEKLYEELLLAGEGVAPTSHEKIRVFNAARYNPQMLAAQIDRLQKALHVMDRESIYAVIRELVPEYKPSDAGKRPNGDRVIMLPTRQRTAVNPG